MYVSSNVTDKSWPRGGVSLQKTSVYNGTADDNGTAGGTSNQPVVLDVLAE